MLNELKQYPVFLSIRTLTHNSIVSKTCNNLASARSAMTNHGWISQTGEYLATDTSTGAREAIPNSVTELQSTKPREHTSLK